MITENIMMDMKNQKNHTNHGSDKKLPMLSSTNTIDVW
jgi:hypothetical protein